MSRQRVDVAIIGCGVVGSACALALVQQGVQVALVEASEPARWSPAQRDLRVYAFSPDNARWLAELGIWDSVRAARLQPYRRMRVWDAAGGSALKFDADALGRSELGWIVEHGLLVDRLWQALLRSDVQLHCPARLQACEQTESELSKSSELPAPGERSAQPGVVNTGVRLQLEDGTRIDAGLAIAADGAQSSLRTLAGIPVQTRDYAQRGVVCYVACEQPHQDTAWQRFLSGGPLALLPVSNDVLSGDVLSVDLPTDDAQRPGGLCSIVWSLPEAEATRIMALDDDAFARELDVASDLCLGHLRPVSKRAAFPLQRQLARDYVHGRIVLMGDAAHVVHPLAGQGVNLGLRDAAAFAQLFESTRSESKRDRSGRLLSAAKLARWARTRRSENAVAAYTFEGIHRLYTDDGVAATLARGHLLGIAGRMPPLVQALWRRAAGG